MKAKAHVKGSSSTTSASAPRREGGGSSITSGANSISTQRLQNHIETDIDFAPKRARRKAEPDKPPEPHQDEQGRTTTMRAAESSLPTTMNAVLRSLDGGPSIVLDRPTMRLGRSVACEILWNHQGISNLHCEFRFEGNWWTVTDLGSKNGVQVNGVDVTSRMLLPGDRLTIARKYHFQIEDPNAEPARVNPLRLLLWILALMSLTTLVGFLAWWFSQS
jgi:pSer/pThr/pTyr-binding forkhead associated (FHA) protein